MAKQEKLAIGNSTIVADNEFADGYYNGKDYYYDTNSRLPGPLSSETVHTFMMDNLLDQQATVKWNSGFVCGWIAALCENNPADFYTSIILPEAIPAPTLQKA